METPQVVGYSKLMSDNTRVHVYLFHDVDTGLITTGLIEFRADNGTVWGSLTEVRPVD
jgi:hypothetical protein